MLRLVSLAGVFAILLLCVLLSKNRKAISWRLVGTGLLLQSLLGLVFLYWDAGNAALRGFGDGVKQFLDVSKQGGDFVFNVLSSYGAVDAAFPGENNGFIFAAQVLPTLIFFSSFMAVLYHLGVMQQVVRAMAVVMMRLMRLSGAESLSACANVFLGQTEAPLMVRPFLARATASELHAIMTGGFATIAGSVFALYVAYGIEPGFLMVASVMAVPAGLVCSKIMWPETGTPETLGSARTVKDRPHANVVEAAAAGAGDGLHLALNVAAMLIAFLGIVAVLNWGLGAISPELTIQSILSWVFYPIACVMGVRAEDVDALARLLGTKIVLTELVAYGDLAKMKADLAPRTVMIASFALCGFANVGSVAVQIGGLGAMAPERKSEIARLGFRTMLAGALATCMTASVAGVISAV